MKPVGLKVRTYINFCKKDNDKDPKFKVDDHFTLSKYTNLSAYLPNWSEEVYCAMEICY